MNYEDDDGNDEEEGGGGLEWWWRKEVRSLIPLSLRKRATQASMYRVVLILEAVDEIT